MNRIIIFTGFFFALWSYCKTTTVLEYKVTYRNGVAIDTNLSSKKFYDSSEKLIREYLYLKGKIAEQYIYVYSMKTIELMKLRKDGVVYIFKNKNRSLGYLNGNLVLENYNNCRGDIMKIINHNVQANSFVTSTEVFKYQYDRLGKILSTTHFYNNLVVDRSSNKYRGNVLVEKLYDYNKCCEGNQSIPLDKTIYKKLSENIIMRYDIISSSIKRSYKSVNNGYYNQVDIVKITNDITGKVIKKELFTPNYSNEKDISIENLYIPKTLQESYFYKYE